MRQRWKQHKKYFDENINRKTPELMAKELQVDLKSLKRYLHRYKVVPPRKQFTLAYRLIKAKYTYPEYFTPTRRFFEATGIGQRRWGLIFRGDEEMTGKEFRSVVEHLKLDKREITKTLNLEIFEDEL